MSNKAYSSYTIVDLNDGLIQKGELSSPPDNPQNNWTYYNTTLHQSFVYYEGQWHVLAKDGEDAINYRIDTNENVIVPALEDGNFIGSPNYYHYDFLPTVYLNDNNLTYEKGDSIPEAVTENYYLIIEDGQGGNGDNAQSSITNNQFRITWKSPSIIASEGHSIKEEFYYTLNLYQNKDNTLIKIATKDIKFSKNKQGNSTKDLTLTSTATEVQVSINAQGSIVYSPSTITFTAEPKNLGNGAFSWVLIDGNGARLKTSDTDSSIEVPISQGLITTNPLPWTIQVTYQETGGEPYTRSITITCPRQIISQEQIVDLDIYYAGSDNSYSAPAIADKNAENNSNWSTDEPEVDWIWKSTRKKTYWKYYFSDAPSTPIETVSQYEWSEPELKNYNAAEIKAFNTLTNNGKFEGHFYGVYVWTNGTNAYFYEVDNYSKHLIIPKDSDIAKNTLRILQSNGVWDRVDTGGIEVWGKKDDDTNSKVVLNKYIDYYVNASMIQTGSLLVGTEDEPIFQAGFDKKSDGSHTVKIAGFDVNNTSLQSSKTGYVYLGTDAIKLGTKSGEHHPFEVNDKGEMYSISGEIGGWNINTKGLETKGSLVSNQKLKSIDYLFAQADDDNDINYENKIYSSTLIGLNGGSPIIVKRIFKYDLIDIPFYSRMRVESIGLATAKITEYVIGYSYSQTSQLPSSTTSLGQFQKSFKQTWQTIAECIIVEWKDTADSGNNILKPLDTSDPFYTTYNNSKISNLSQQRTVSGNFIFGLNADSNFKYPSLIKNNTPAQIIFYGGSLQTIKNAPFKILEDGSTYVGALNTPFISHENTKLLFGATSVHISENTIEQGITMYTPSYTINDGNLYRGFYIGFDGANFCQLRLQGKRLSIGADGYVRAVEV